MNGSIDILIIGICILAFIIGYIIVSWLVKFFQKSSSSQRFYNTSTDREETNYHEQINDYSYERPWYVVLGVGPNASPHEVRNAYKKLIKQYHPDKLSNLAPELKNIAEKRTKELNRALYEGLKKGHQ